MTSLIDVKAQLLAISLEAAEWLIRFEAREVSCSEHMRYLEWLRRSPLHIQEMQKVLQLRAALGTPDLLTRESCGHKRRARCHHGRRARCRGREWNAHTARLFS